MHTRENKGAIRQPQSILIVDDDIRFRYLLSGILTTHGHTVVEARSAKEAMTALNNNIGLVIVDYRLPGTDGAAFISQMREAGIRTPVVFISGTFCDAKTFNWLRNILGVSLVLQKPIQANLLIQQLATVLPKTTWEGELEDVTEWTALPIRELDKAIRLGTTVDLEKARPQIGMDPTPASQPPELTQGSNESADELLLQLQQMRKKLAAEENIRQMQAKLRKSIPEEWDKFSAAIANVQSDANDSESRQLALDLAHKLAGTTGSLGLSRVSNCAARIEDYLKMLDPSAPTESEVLWSEIFRALANGETGLKLAESMEQSSESTETFSAGQVLILGDVSELNEPVSQINPFVDVQFTFAATPIEAVMKASAMRFDSVIIDCATCDRETLSQLTKEIRLANSNRNLPLALIHSKKDRLKPSDLIHWGICALLPSPLRPKQLEEALQNLTQSSQIQQPRVLTVDDDEVLTRFICEVLSSKGMYIEALNEPIRTPEILGEFEPDLVLLDVVMPGLSGYDVCRLIRENEKWKSLPIIFLTSKSDSAGRAAAFHAGGNDFLSKPIISEELSARVKAQLNSAQTQRQAVIVDEATGTLKLETFTRRMKDALSKVRTVGGELSLCLVSINKFDKLEKHGMFSELKVTSSIGKLLNARFKANALRGRWDQSTFAIAMPGNTEQDVRDSMLAFSKEVEQLSFSTSLESRFDVGIAYGVGTFPQNGKTVEDLIEAASLDLKTTRKEAFKKNKKGRSD